ncbi:MAG: diguanylate cyclase [Thermodesulfovibrionales bacterium]
MERGTILLLEGEEHLAESVKLTLESNGYDTLISEDTEKGIALCNKFKPGIILLDMTMNGSTDFIKKVRELDNENVEIILFMSQDAPYCPDLGALRYLRKPFEIEDLICSIKEAEDKLGLRDERNRFLIKLMEYSEGLEKLVEKKTAELTSANERLRALSVTDDLTGAYNRRYFFERLEEGVNQATRYGLKLSVIILDIDNFKSINDCMGHLTGDLVLREFTALLKNNFRKGETVARYGGEEFAVILPNTDEAGGLKAAEIMRKKVESKVFQTGTETINITVSIGVAEFNNGIKDLDDVIVRADMALYRAKNAGKNMVSSLPGKDKSA